MTFIESIQNYRPGNAQEASDQSAILEYIRVYEHNILTRKNQIAHMTSSGLILNPNLDKMLMIHHNIYETWTWTGGHADGESDMLHTAIKEAVEETGVQNIKPLTPQMVSLDILPVYGHMKKGEYVSAHLHLNTSYALIAQETEALIVNEDESSDVQWIDVGSLSDYSNEPYFIDVYMKIIHRARALR